MRSRLAPILALLVVLPGCLVTGVLDPAGGARLTLHVHLVSVAHFEGVKAGLQSPDVVLKSASMTPKKFATFELELADVRKISTAPSLSQAAVALIDDQGERTLEVTLSNPAPPQWSEALQRYLGGEVKIAIALPGDVTASNASSTQGRTVTWSWPMGEAVGRPRTDLAATFKIPTKSAGAS